MRLPFIKIVAVSLSLAALTAAPSSAQVTNDVVDQVTQDWSRYVEPMQLSGLMTAQPNVQVLDIRSEKDVNNGTIPGAIWIPFAEFRGPAERPGEVPSEIALERILGDNGLRLDQPIVVVNKSGRTIQTGRAAIVYWILKSAGGQDLAILDGGFKAWEQEGLPEAIGPTVAEPQMVNVEYTTQWWAGPIDIFGVTTGQVEGAILDARLDSQVRKSMETGKPLMSMPMARYIPSSFFTNPLSDQSLEAESQVAFRSALEDRGVDLNSDGFLISVCQTGELSALSWFYASEILGIENVRYYPDAIKGWQSDGGVMFGMRAEQ